jgi:hypothetical protein
MRIKKEGRIARYKGDWPFLFLDTAQNYCSYVFNFVYNCLSLFGKISSGNVSLLVFFGLF